MRRRLNIETAFRLYLTQVELTNEDIREIFGVSGNETVRKIKEPVLAAMQERKTPRYGSASINTDVAFEVWHIDPEMLQQKFDAMQKYGLAKHNTVMSA